MSRDLWIIDYVKWWIGSQKLANNWPDAANILKGVGGEPLETDDATSVGPLNIFDEAAHTLTMNHDLKNSTLSRETDQCQINRSGGGYRWRKRPSTRYQGQRL